jgi:hypothetical protein
MRIDVSKRAITFIGSDEPVARTVANGEGILLDLDAEGRVIAVEIHEKRGLGSFPELAKQYGDLEDFMNEAIRTLDEAAENVRMRFSMNRRQSRRLNHVRASLDRHHVVA